MRFDRPERAGRHVIRVSACACFGTCKNVEPTQRGTRLRPSPSKTHNWCTNTIASSQNNPAFSGVKNPLTAPESQTFFMTTSVGTEGMNILISARAANASSDDNCFRGRVIESQCWHCCTDELPDTSPNFPWPTNLFCDCRILIQLTMH
jgi:hypothetical protein